MRKPRRHRQKVGAPIRPVQTPSSGLSENRASNNGAPEKVITETEASLTAKNYRLAKELAEIRLKHKEVVTNEKNLTIENMKIASQFRQAMNHIEKLTKELHVYQQQEEEHQKRKQSSSTKARHSPTSHPPDMENDLTRNEEEGRSYYSTPHTNSNGNGSSSHRRRQPSTANHSHTNKSAPQDNSPTPSIALEIEQDGNTNDEITTAAETPPPVTPQSDEDSSSLDLSPPFESNPADIAFGDLDSSDFFQQGSYENSLPTTAEKENVEIDNVTKDFDAFVSISNKIGSASDNNANFGNDGNFDAFEASFQTTFPSSFNVDASSFNGGAKEMDNSFGGMEFSDSFFMDVEHTPGNSQKKNNKAPIDDDNSPVDITSSSHYGHDTNKHDAHDISCQTKRQLYPSEIDAPMDEALGLFPNSAMDEFEPRFSNKTENIARTSPSNTIAATRSRFERKEPGEENLAPRDEADVDIEELDHSPTLVLKRLHQRKAKANSSLSSSSPVSNDRVSGSKNEEMRKLDAMAHGTMPARESRRRSVRQPVSYTEPSLNSKLRRGDVYFQKETNDEQTEGETEDLREMSNSNDTSLKDKHMNSEILANSAS